VTRRLIVSTGAACLITVTALAAAGGGGVWLGAYSVTGSVGTSSGGKLSLQGVIGQSEAGGASMGGGLSVQGGFYAPPPVLSCPPDLDGDDVVGAADLSLLLASWGAPSEADLDGDGIVGASDLSLLLAAWGLCD
jgi:hypothetical protein